MSRINDALKRASQSDRNRSRPAETKASARPVAGGRGSSVSLALVAGVVLALGLAGWFFWQWWNTSRPPGQARGEPVAAAAPKVAPAPIAREAVLTPAPVAPGRAAVSSSAPAPASAPMTPGKAAQAPWPADLKVMGIFFSKTNPRALINGTTVGVGDQIDGIRVIKIEDDRVSVEWNGRVKQLLME